MSIPNSLFPRPEAKFNVNATVNLWSLYIDYTNGKILDYDNNRGLQGLDKARVKKMASKFNINALQAVTLSLVDGKQQLMDFHHRMAAIELVVGQGRFLDEWKKISIPAVLIPQLQAIEIYGKINDNKHHSGANKISNSDLRVGAYVAELAPLMPVQKASWLQCLADVLLAVENLEADTIDTQDFFKARKIVSDHANEVKDKKDALVSKTTVDKVKAALVRFSATYDAMQAKKKTSTPNACFDDVLNNTGFFMGFMSDALGEKVFSTRQPKYIAQRAFSRANKLLIASREISRRNSRDMKNAAKFSSLLAA